jgi:hypothetical protein
VIGIVKANSGTTRSAYCATRFGLAFGVLLAILTVALMFRLGYCAVLLEECLDELPASWSESDQ